MVIIWLMMANNNLVSGRPTPLQNDGGVKSVGMMKFHFQYDGKNHPVMFQSPPSSFLTGIWIPKNSTRHPSTRAKKLAKFCPNIWHNMANLCWSVLEKMVISYIPTQNGKGLWSVINCRYTIIQWNIGLRRFKIEISYEQMRYFFPMPGFFSPSACLLYSYGKLPLDWWFTCIYLHIIMLIFHRKLLVFQTVTYKVPSGNQKSLLWYRWPVCYGIYLLKTGWWF